MYRVFLSWRFLRRRRTNLIGVFGIFLAVGALILILSIMTGFLEETRRSARGSLSDLILTLPPYKDARRPREPGPILEAIRADPRVEGASAHLGWMCILTRQDESSLRILIDSQSSEIAGIKLTGVDANDEKGSTEFLESLDRVGRNKDGEIEYDSTVGRPRASVVVGEKVMAYHRLRRGSFITLMTAVPDPGSDTGWSAKKREFVVAGTFRSGENEIDLERVYVDREQLARFLAGASEDDPVPSDAILFSEVLVKLKDYSGEAEAVREELGASLYKAGLIDESCSLRTWEEFRGTLLGAIENERVLMGIMLSLILVVAGFTIFAILSMMVTEKRRDIGILTALGATPNGVLALFLLIGFWDALIGAISGAVIGTWMAIKIDPFERWLSDTFGVQIFNRDVYLFDSIPSVVTPLAVGLIVLGAFVCTLVFAAIPAWRAAHLDPVEALRND
ncbi:MAG: FtsX-like permease family protein [Planctomycetota bacterium]|nr:FtsX-like permease family protein [Planctomycetota bacterium]